MFQRFVYVLVVVILGMSPAISAASSALKTQDTAGGVLYLADDTTGFGDWTEDDGWVTVSDMLVNDGSKEAPIFLPAPVELLSPDYAVEVEIQRVRGGDTFGIVARGVDGGGYWIGFGNTCHDNWEIAIWAGTPPRDASTGMCGLEKENLIHNEGSFRLDKDWHEMRVELEGNTLRVIIDETVEAEVSDNTFLQPGEVGLWSGGAQFSIRSFAVIDLEEGS